MDGSIHAATTEQGFVGGIDDGIHMQGSDVSDGDSDIVVGVVHGFSY